MRSYESCLFRTKCTTRFARKCTSSFGLKCTRYNQVDLFYKHTKKIDLIFTERFSDKINTDCFS